MKKIYIMMMLVLAGTMATAQTSVWHGGRQVWTRGTGTESDPFLIESADNLAYLAYVVNKGYETEGMYFRLTTDIDLNGSEDQQWVPIGIGLNRWFSEDGCDRGQASYAFYGIPQSSFRGHFDGGEHNISNIYINSTDDVYQYAGLFGSVEGRQEGQEVYPATIENVFVTSGYIRGRSCGGIVEKGSYTIVSRCWNGANIESLSDAGGIVGEYGYQIYNCYNVGDISGYRVGGIVGYYGAEIEECYNEGDITGTYAGGIYGYTLNGHVTINNCYNTGSITANEDYGTALPSAPAGPAAGGIASFIFRGNLGNSAITNCYNVGDVSSIQDAGCILAYGPQVTLENNYYISTCDAGGEGEPLSEDYMRSQEFVDYLNGRDGDQVWALDEDYINDGFPILVEVSTLEVSEQAEATFSVYPNPANGAFIVEGTGQMTVSNVLGQIILTKEIDGQTAVALPQGLYFVKLGGAVRKIVVE